MPNKKQDTNYLEETTFILAELGIPYSVKRSKRRKRTLSIKIDENENVIILCPWRTSKNEIEQLLREKKNWITRTLIMRQKAKQRQSSIETGKIMFLGEQYVLKTPEAGRRQSNVRIDGTTIIVEIKETFGPEERSEKIRKTLVKWLRKRAKEIIGERVRKFQEIMNVQPKEIKIRNYKARWGSHNGKGVITFNLFLVMAPLEIVDYVVVHELAHLIENNHSKKFWCQVEKILPDYRQRRIWLRENGIILRI